MTFEEKIRILQTYLSQVDDTYRDSYKTDITLFFNDDFRAENSLLSFLNNLNDKNEITKWVDEVTSQIVLKFDEDFEDIGSFIGEFVELKDLNS
jgi:hypothetical protein